MVRDMPAQERDREARDFIEAVVYEIIESTSSDEVEHQFLPNATVRFFDEYTFALPDGSFSADRSGRLRIPADLFVDDELYVLQVRALGAMGTYEFIYDEGFKDDYIYQGEVFNIGINQSIRLEQGLDRNLDIRIFPGDDPRRVRVGN